MLVVLCQQLAAPVVERVTFARQRSLDFGRSIAARMSGARFMNRKPLQGSDLCGGRAVQDRRKHGCLRGAPMDGFTAFLNSPPTGRGAANHCRRTFMNRAYAQFTSKQPPPAVA